MQGDKKNSEGNILCKTTKICFAYFTEIYYADKKICMHYINLCARAIYVKNIVVDNLRFEVSVNKNLYKFQSLSKGLYAHYLIVQQ